MTATPEELENLKFQLTSQVEEKKWGYRKQELEYLEAGQHLRALNQIMWQVPGMAIAVTGGLWYGVTTVEADLPKIFALIFVAIVDAITIPIIWRLRGVIDIQIKVQRSFSPSLPQVKKERDRVVVSCWAFILALAATLSVIAAANVSQLNKQKKDDPKGQAECRVEADIKVELSPATAASAASLPAKRQIYTRRKQCP